MLTIKSFPKQCPQCGGHGAIHSMDVRGWPVNIDPCHVCEGFGIIQVVRTGGLLPDRHEPWNKIDEKHLVS